MTDRHPSELDACEADMNNLLIGRLLEVVVNRH